MANKLAVVLVVAVYAGVASATSNSSTDLALVPQNSSPWAAHCTHCDFTAHADLEWNRIKVYATYQQHTPPDRTGIKFECVYAEPLEKACDYLTFETETVICNYQGVSYQNLKFAPEADSNLFYVKITAVTPDGEVVEDAYELMHITAKA